MSTIPSQAFAGFPLPSEIIVNFFSFLPPRTLVNFKTTCKHYQSLVESDVPSQQRIAEHYLKIMHSYEVIPQNDLKYFCNNTCFAMQIQGEFNIHHLVHSLTPTLPWISHLIVKNCETRAQSLTDLFNFLKNRNNLSFLYLYRCKFDETSSTALLEVSKNTKKDFKIYSTEIEDDRFHIENHEPGDNMLDAFVQEVSNPNSPSSVVLEALDALKSTIKIEVIKSIWNSLLTDIHNGTKNADYMIEKTRLYIQEYPHHPAIIAAAKMNKDKYSSIYTVDT